MPTRGVRPHRPKRQGPQATEHAKGATFAQLTTARGTGQVATSPEETAPFRGADAAALKRRYGHYDIVAQGWIARALTDPWVQAKKSGNTGTAPELVVVGRFLSRGYIMHRTVFFQEKRVSLGALVAGLRTPRSVFVADVAINGPGGDLIFLPIDGVKWHASTLKQVLDVRRRDAALGQVGRVLAIPDTECMSGVRLDAFLRRNRVP